MKRIIKIASSVLIAIATTKSVFGQAFPQIWETLMYDFSQGTKGRLNLINYGGSHTPNPDKAYIFATDVIEDNSVVTRDLFRLTLSGVFTFNSPFSGYEAKVNFANRGNIVGGIIATNNNYLRIHGKSGLSLGSTNDQNLLQLNLQSAVFSTPIIYTNKTDQLNFSIGRMEHKNYILLASAITAPIAIGSREHVGIIVDYYSNVYIGMKTDEYERISSTLKGKYNLFVKEGILAEDYAIAPTSSWVDFVFDTKYKLRPLNEVESFINANNHLPDVPSAIDISTEGYSQHDMNKVLLQKIEELTLYIIHQNKEIQTLKSEMNK